VKCRCSVNEVLFNQEIMDQPEWSRSIGGFGDEKIHLITRIKKSGDQIIALEERIILSSAAKRFNKEQIQEQSFFDLLEIYPEFEIKETKYILSGTIYRFIKNRHCKIYQYY